MIPLITVTLKQYDADGHILSLKIPFALVDSGATESYINKSILPDAMFTEKLSSPENISNAFEDEISHVKETMLANLVINDCDIEIPKVAFNIVDRNMKYNAIIGMDIINNFKIDFRNESIKFINNLHIKKRQMEIITTVLEARENPKHGDILAQRNTEVSPHSNRKLYIKINGNINDLKKHVFTTQEELLEHRISIDHGELNSKMMITIENRSNAILIIEKNAKLGFIKKPDGHHCLNFLLLEKDLDPFEQITHNKELKIWRQKRNLLVKHHPVTEQIEEIVINVPKRYKEQLSSILEKHNWCFSRSVSDAGLSKHYVTELRLRDNYEPVYTRPYKIDNSMLTNVETKLKELKEAGIIEECCSAWNSPVLFIKKKDDSIRVVNNYSAPKDKSVNSRLIVPKYPSLPIRSVLAKVSTAISTLRERYPHDKIYFVSLDVRNAFYSISIREKSRDITSFLFGGEQFRYQRMSQGLSSSPATFQYFINKVMSKTKGINDEYFLINYLDDFFVIVPESLHNKCVDCLLQRMADENLVVAIQKCEFFKTECKFLGFLITETGISAQNMKVEALTALDYPKNLKEAQRFMGCLNYYSRLIPKMSALLSPMTKEIGKGKEYTLTDEIIKNIDELKKIIKQGVSVDHLRYQSGSNGDYLFIAADTSLTRTGSIIGNLTMNEDIIRNVSIAGYASRALDNQETLLSSRARELIGIGHALKAFEDLIPKDRKFIILCDHKSLEGAKHSTKLKTSGSSRVRLAFSRLLEFPLCTVHYVPAEHPVISVADSLSRLPVLEVGKVNKSLFEPSKVMKEGLELNTIDSNIQAFSQQRPVVDISTIIDHQKRSDKFSKIRKKLWNQRSIKIDNTTYMIANDILYRSSERGDLLAVIPKSLTKDLINFYHVATAHSGKNPIDEKLKNEPLWLENKTKILTEAVSGCLFCSLVQPSRFKSKQDIVAIKPAFSSYKKVFIDLIELSVSGKLLHFLTFLDDFSLYLSVKRVMSKKKHDVIPQLILLLSEYGCQGHTLCVSDNGGEFINSTLKEALEFMNIDQSFISPYNSRANRVERAHRDLRAFIRTANVKFTDANFIVKMSCNLYNHRPKESLKGLTPSQVSRNIDPPIHFGSLKLTTEGTNFKDIEGYMNLLENYHVEIAKIKREKYAVKDKIINELKQDDIVVVKNKSDLLNSHRKTNLGPYKVLERKGSSSAYLIEHILFGTRLVRNRRYLIKISLSTEDKSALESKKTLMFNNNYEILESDNNQQRITRSPLDIKNLKSTLKQQQEQDTDTSTLKNQKSPKPYSLRQHKRVNYKE
jgi:hypothetical protein